MFGWSWKRYDPIAAGMAQQMVSQREFVERHTRKGALWFWEEIPNPYPEWPYLLRS
jgi:hypothetical protein